MSSHSKQVAVKRQEQENGLLNIVEDMVAKVLQCWIPDRVSSIIQGCG